MTRRNIVKCQCCNKRMKKIVEYHCHTEDCEDHIIYGEFSKEHYMSLKYRWHETWADYLGQFDNYDYTVHEGED